MRSPLSVDDARLLARRRLPRVAFDFIDGGADDEVTMRENRRALQQDFALRPRVLSGVAVRDQSVTVLGRQVETPVILGPAGLLRIAHNDGEKAAAQAASKQGTVYTVTSNASVALEDVARHAAKGSLWFQLYLWRNRQRNAELLRRAEASGCETLVVTVDTPVVGNRERDRRNGFVIPLKPNISMAIDVARHPRWPYGLIRGGPITFANFTEMGKGGKPKTLFKYINEELAHPGATFGDLDWLRANWDGSLVIKGVMTREDAEKAISCGVDGICVSNHGGRQIDGVQASIAVLPDIVEAARGRAEIFVDGGIRRGTDVVKALALGARAVFVARPYVYGLAIGGEAGVERVLEIFKNEIDVTLALIGCPNVADIDASFVTETRTMRNTWI